MKFNLQHLIIKLTSRKLWIWIITTLFTYRLLMLDGEHSWFIPLIIVWGVISFVYLAGDVLIDAISELVKNGKLTIDTKIGK